MIFIEIDILDARKIEKHVVFSTSYHLLITKMSIFPRL